MNKTLEDNKGSEAPIADPLCPSCQRPLKLVGDIQHIYAADDYIGAMLVVFCSSCGHIVVDPWMSREFE